MLPTIKSLRDAAGGLANLTDEDIVQAVYPQFQQYYDNVDSFAKEMGYGGAGRGLTGARISSGIDNYQAGMYGLGGAVSRAVGAEGAANWFDRQREENEAAANYAAQRARQLGGIDSWKDVHGAGDFLNYAGGMAAQSLPYAAEAMVGGLAARGLATGTRAALAAARTPEEVAAASRALGAYQTAGGVAASYPSSVGDILGNQREAGGENLGAAMLGGVPYAALNAFGVEGMAARGLRPFAAGESRLARMATGAASTAVGEGFGEAGQEVANQYFGRMAVNPSETLFNESAMERYGESFAGGATLGLFTGGMGGIRRPRTVDQGQFDMTQGQQQQQGEVLGLGYSPLAGTPVVFPDGSIALNGDQEMQHRYNLPKTDPLAGVDVPGAETTAPAVTPSILDDVDNGLTQMGIPLASGTKAREKQRTFYQAAVDSGIPLDSDLLTPYWTAIADRKFGDKTKVALQNAIVAHRKEQADVSTSSAVVPGSAPGTDGGSPDVQRGVVNRGPVDPGVAAGGGNAVGAGAAAPQALAVPNTQQQPAAPVGVNHNLLTRQDPFQVSQSMQPAPLVDTSEDAREIAAMTGNAGEVNAVHEDSEGLRADATEAPKADRDAIVAARFGKSKNAERDGKILSAYLTALRTAPQDSKLQVQQAIGKQFGVTPERVRQIGNPQELARVGEDMGFTREQVFEALGVNDNAKGETSEVGQIEHKLKTLKQEYNRAAKAEKQGIADEMARTSEQLAKAKDKAEEARRLAVSDGLRAQGIESVEGESSGMGGLDEDRMWLEEAEAGSQDALAIVNLADQIDAMREALAEYESQGMSEAAGLFQTKIAEAQSALDALLQGVPDAVQEQSAGAVDVRREAGNGEAVGKGNAQSETPAGEGQSQALTTAKPQEVATGRRMWASLQKQIPGLVPYDSLTKNEREYLNDLATRTDGKPVIAKEMGLQELLKLSDESDIIDVEARVVEETVGREVAKLPDARVERLEKHYGLARDTKEFLAKVKEDVVLFAAKGANAVNAAIRDIIKAIHSGVLSVAMIFNPTFISPPSIVPVQEQTTVTTTEVRAEVPAAAEAKMSESAKQAYATLYPSIKDQLQANDKLMVIMDKPNGRMFVFNPDGSLLLDKKVLVGAAKGDYYKGNNNVTANRITPAGLFTMGLRDAARSSSEAKTAGEYDTGKVFVLDKAIDGEYSITMMHSVWLHEKDAPQRAAALKNANAADSRYSFGCINVDKDTYAGLVKDHLAQMDGAALFVVPDDSAATAEFLKGETAQNKSGKDSLTRTTFTPKTETTITRTTTPNATGQQSSRDVFGKENDNPIGPTNSRPNGATLGRYNAMRGRRTIVTDGDGKDLVIKGVSRADLSNQYDEVTFAFSEYSIRGLGNIPDAIGGWWTTNSDPNWDGVFAGEVDGEQGGHIILNESSMEDPDRAEWTVHHEIGHFLDGTHLDGEGIYSGMPQMSTRVVDDKIVPVGKVMREIVSHYNAVPDSPVSTRLVYPLDRSQNGDLNAERVREEVFAQLWAMYMTDGGREFLQSELPATAAFMETVYGDVRQTYGGFTGYGPATTNGAATQGQAGGQTTYRPGQSGQVRGEADTLRPSKTQQVTPEAVKKPVGNLTRVLKTYASKALNTIMFSEDLFKRAASMGISAAQEMGRLYQQRAALTGQIEREVTRIEQMFNRIKNDQRQAANDFVRDMRFAKAWGFRPDWRKDSDKVKLNPELEKQFNALPQEAQAWTRAVFQHGDKMRQLKQEAVRKSFDSVYDARIADAKKANDADKVTKLEAEKTAEMKRFQRLFAQDEYNPYAPVRRFGNWVVVGKSKEYVAAEEAGDTKQMAKLESDSDHYFVDFRENYGEALTLSQRLQENGLISGEPREKEMARNDMYGGLMSAFDKLRGNIESELGNATTPAEKKALAAARDVAVDLYLRSLADTSARKSELRFKAIAGDIDMLRSFSSQGRADAHFLAAATFNPQMTETVTKMRQQKKVPGNDTQKSMVFNELMARHEQSMKYHDGGWFDAANKATAVTSGWMLATSPMYYLQNLTQPMVVSLPYLTGKHDYTSAWGQLMRAYHQLGPLITSAKAAEGFNFNKVPDDVREAILTLVDRGRIDIGMDTELGKVKLEGEGMGSKLANRTSQFFRSLAQKAEAINRVSTAMAAYRLELKRTGDAKAALEYADEVLDKTHGNYTASNAPRAFNTPAGKVALQFRKFQLIQLTLLAKLTHDAFKGASPVERAAARKMLAFTLGHTGVLAGVVGMPGFAAAAFIINKLADLFGDDDEPYNLENELRKILGDGELARVVMRGLPMAANMDISGKVGMGNALSILPYTDADFTREGFNAIATGLTLGATGGLGARVWEAMGDIKKGDYYRGLAGLAPKGLADAMRGYDALTSGLTRKNGDMLVSPDNVSTFEGFAKAIGLTTATESERKFDQGVVYDNKQAFEDRANQLKNQYVLARKKGDSDAATKAMQGWQKLQANRREAGLAAQPMSTLIKAPMQQMKRERMTSGGVQYDKNTRRMVLEQTQ